MLYRSSARPGHREIAGRDSSGRGSREHSSLQACPEGLAPTSFFERNLQPPADEAGEDEEKIANESILDLAMAAFRPARTLRWHYRSRHVSLIAFSNRHFYDDQLIVFPTPNHQHPEFGVRFRHVAGVYEHGTNLIEAQAMVEPAICHMHRHPDRSLAIVTMNQAQKELIKEEMERMIAPAGFS